MLNETIAKLRKEKNISQEELANILNTSRQAISKWERGEAYPDIDKLKDLAIYFHVSIDYLLDYDVESISINNFIKRIKESFEQRVFNIDLDEIGLVVSRNKNNFELLICSIEYLFAYWQTNNRDEIIDLIVEYSKRALAIFRSDNSLNVKEEDIKRVIAITYMINDKYDLAKDYITNNNVAEMDTYLAVCEYQLGNFDKSADIISSSFIESVSVMINCNLIKSLLFMKDSKFKEVLDLCNWTLSFIKSIENEGDLLSDIVYIFMFLRTLCKKLLNIDIDEDLRYLKNNKNKIKTIHDLNNIKFYSENDNYITTLTGSIKKLLYKEINNFKDKDFYESALAVYNEVFGE